MLFAGELACDHLHFATVARKLVDQHGDMGAGKREIGDLARQDIRAARQPCMRLLRCDRLGGLGEGISWRTKTITR
jgi:hypothetical protein